MRHEDWLIDRQAYRHILLPYWPEITDGGLYGSILIEYRGRNSWKITNPLLVIG
jgi:hypothetical protein